jgi:hypothetical protein
MKHILGFKLYENMNGSSIELLNNINDIFTWLSEDFKSEIQFQSTLVQDRKLHLKNGETPYTSPLTGIPHSGKRSLINKDGDVIDIINGNVNSEIEFFRIEGVGKNVDPEELMDVITSIRKVIKNIEDLYDLEIIPNNAPASQHHLAGNSSYWSVYNDARGKKTFSFNDHPHSCLSKEEIIFISHKMWVTKLEFRIEFRIKQTGK